MALIKHHKYVAALPATLEANAIYYVRAGDGFDLYVTNSNGQVVAYPANSKWDALKAPAIATGVLTIDLATPAGFRVALNQNVSTLSFANVPSGRVVVFTITWVQDAAGGRTVAFPASVKADGGGAPVQPAAGANAVTVQSFYTDDGGVTFWQAGSADAALSARVSAVEQGKLDKSDKRVSTGYVVFSIDAGVLTVRDSFGIISSVTRRGVGQYRVNFSQALSLYYGVLFDWSNRSTDNGVYGGRVGIRDATFVDISIYQTNANIWAEAGVVTVEIKGGI